MTKLTLDKGEIENLLGFMDNNPLSDFIFDDDEKINRIVISVFNEKDIENIFKDVVELQGRREWQAEVIIERQ